MALYDVSYYCEECHETHPMGVALRLKGAPGHRTSLRAFALDRNLPSVLSEVVGSPVLCPQTGKRIVTRDPTRIFIEPVTQGAVRK